MANVPIVKKDEIPNPGSDLTVAELRKTHILYDENIDEWRFLIAAYEGTRELVKKGYLVKNPRESDDNYVRRKKEAAGFDYSKSIVDLFNFYLFKKEVNRTLGKLESDELWAMFMNDCNLFNDSFDDFLTEQGRYASIFGHIGIMVDKASEKYENKKEEIENKVYPYLNSYFPTAILDWEYRRDKNNRPYLHYIKLLDDDGQYRLWWQGIWEIWKEPKDTKKNSISGVKPETAAEKVNWGNYSLQRIPFIFLLNIKSKIQSIGMSDIHEVARLDVGILRNLSQSEEVIGYAAFPMMRKPDKEARPDGGVSITDADEVGVDVILTFDKDNPQSKPDWLEARVKEPIDAILSMIAHKAKEIYRVVNAGGMASTEISTQAKSGVALKSEFQLLNASLVRKAKNLERTERDIVKLWLAWQLQSDWYGDVIIERNRSYDVEDLASDLENALTSSIIVKSSKFNARIQKKVARQMLPGIEDDEIKEIEDEIDEIASMTMFSDEGDEDQF